MKTQALYLMQQHEVEAAISKYREFVSQTGAHDFEVLQQMGLVLLQKGIQTSDPHVFMMTLFGAGLSGSSGALEILERGLAHPDPHIQLVSLHFIAQFEEDRMQELLNLAMNSNYLSTRMEAAFHMAQRKHPLAMGQIEGLMFRLPPVFKPYFPSFFALLGTNDATQALKRLLDDPDLQVRVEAILNIGKAGRDDFLPFLRKRLSHAQIAELEAVAFTIGILKDTSSIPKLKKLVGSQIDSVKLAAALALYHLEDRSYIPLIFEMAQNKNLFAINALGQIDGSEELLQTLVQSSDLQVRINAGAALLQRHEISAVNPILEILISDSRDLAFCPTASVGRSQMAMKAVPSAELHAKDPTLNLGFSVAIREHLLRESIHLPEKSFLHIVQQLFKKGQNDLIPVAINLLENLRTDGAVSLLKEGTQMISYPLVRDYSHLALYRLKEEGIYESYVNQWVMQQKHEELIRLRPLLPWKYRLEQTDYTLTPDETSHLLVESFLSIANQRNEKSISFLLEAIQSSLPANRYALMGLLMKATE